MLTKGERHQLIDMGDGQSLRDFSFEQFDAGQRPADVIEETGEKASTIYRYFQDWKALPQGYRQKRVLHQTRNLHRAFHRETVLGIARQLGVSEPEARARLQKPYGLYQLLMGRWPEGAELRAKDERQERLQIALSVVDLLEAGHQPADIIRAVGKLLDQEAGPPRGLRVAANRRQTPAQSPPQETPFPPLE